MSKTDMHESDICERILEVMALRRERYGEVLLRTKDIAREMNMTVGLTREYLDILYHSGIIDCTPVSRGVPVLWFLN